MSGYFAVRKNLPAYQRLKIDTCPADRAGAPHSNCLERTQAFLSRHKLLTTSGLKRVKMRSRIKQWNVWGPLTGGGM